MPAFPLYYQGSTKFSPIHCSDLTDVISHIISNDIYSRSIDDITLELEKIIN